jgi:hypothetical protein
MSSILLGEGVVEQLALEIGHAARSNLQALDFGPFLVRPRSVERFQGLFDVCAKPMLRGQLALNTRTDDARVNDFKR